MTKGRTNAPRHPTSMRRRIGLLVLGLIVAVFFGGLLWVGTLSRLLACSRLAADGAQTVGVVTRSWSTTYLRSGRVIWRYDVEFAGHSATKVSHSGPITTGTRLPLLYLLDDPSVVAVGHRGDSTWVLAESEFQEDVPIVIGMGIWYGILMMAGLWLAWVGRPKRIVL
jgi:hypothetical protein